MNLNKKYLIAAGVLVILGILASATTIIVLMNKHDKTDCEIYPFEAPLAPLLLLPKSSDFIYPKSGEKLLKFSSGQTLEFSCPGRQVILDSLETTMALIQGTCISRQKFKINDKEVQWGQIRCDNVPWRSAKYTGNQCEEEGKEIEVGFDLEDRFLRSMIVCFNNTMQIAHYSFFNLTSSINQRELGTARPSWLQGTGFYDIGTITNYYVRRNQRATINSLLGLNENSTKYIEDDTNYFLARGHLTARSDNFYPAQQNATFFIMNIAPQWQTFNGFNWNQIEMDVRDYAEEKGVDLQVWTGIYGVATLPHEETGVETELFLYVNETSNRKALPVPAIYWKVAYNSITERGVALIGINNPYLGNLTTICNDISHRLTWVNWKKDNQQQGFCYACSVDTFRRVVNTMPDIPVRGLLL